MTRFLAILVTLLTLLTPFLTRAQDQAQSRAEALQPVSRALAYLARQQQPDGSFTALDEAAPRGLTASLAVLAFLSAGQTPGEGRYGLAAHNAVEYLVRYLPEDEDFGRADGSGTRGQAFITIALAQAWGADRDPTQRQQIHAMLDRALATILNAQDLRDPAAGGWPLDGQGEPKLYPTALMTLTLRALEDAGLPVPAAAKSRAAAFARACMTKDGKSFTERGTGQPTPAATAAAAAILLCTDNAKAADVTPLLTPALSGTPDAPADADAFTRLYLDLVAARLCEAPAGKTPNPAWPPAWRRAREALQSKSKQAEDGSWSPTRAPAFGTGSVETTALATMTLAIPYRALPLYGR